VNKDGSLAKITNYNGEDRYDTSHGLEEAFASAGALVGNEQLGRSIYMGASLVNPASSSGKLKAGIKAAETVGDASKKVKQADKAIEGTQVTKSTPKLTVPGAGDNIPPKGTDDADEVVDLYRAVSPAEYDDIMKNKVFRPGPRSYEGKQFGLSFDEILRLSDFFPDSAAIVKSKNTQISV
jgi:hypothetical protein